MATPIFNELREKPFGDAEMNSRNKYKSIEQIVKLGKATTKPVSIRMNTDTLKYFEENAEIFKTKTGTIISNLLDDYVENARREERAQLFEVESALRQIYRLYTSENGEAALCNWLIDEVSKGQNKYIDITQKLYKADNMAKTIFYDDGTKNRNELVEDIIETLSEMKEIEPSNVTSSDVHDMDELVGYDDMSDSLYISIDGKLFVPRAINSVFESDYDFLWGIYAIPVKDWLLISALVIECMSIKSRQLGRKISLESLMRVVIKGYELMQRQNERLENTVKEEKTKELPSWRFGLGGYRHLIYAMARYKDIPCMFERPENLDGESI